MGDKPGVRGALVDGNQSTSYGVEVIPICIIEIFTNLYQLKLFDHAFRVMVNGLKTIMIWKRI